LINGDGESAEAHRKFYNEYMSVMDISADFYLQTVDTVFKRQLLPKGEMKWRDPATGQLLPVDPKAIKKTPLLTIEGELDDISASGQTTAAHVITTNLPAGKQYHHYQLNCGHYGIFNGRRWREEIMPRIRHFIRQFDDEAEAIPKADLQRIPDLKAEQWSVKKHGIEAVRARQADAPRKQDEPADA
jgi:poly(3-hydroxybutyrate) depolymerase